MVKCPAQLTSLLVAETNTLSVATLLCVCRLCEGCESDHFTGGLLRIQPSPGPLTYTILNVRRYMTHVTGLQVRRRFSPLPVPSTGLVRLLSALKTLLSLLYERNAGESCASRTQLPGLRIGRWCENMFRVASSACMDSHRGSHSKMPSTWTVPCLPQVSLRLGPWKFKCQTPGRAGFASQGSIPG